MRYEVLEVQVPGQMDGPAKLTAYVLDNISVAEDRRRPAVIVVPGGGYWNRSDREKEPVAMQFLAMGCHAFVLDYSVAPHHFPVSVRELFQAAAMIRERAEEWNVDPDGILVCGFSAGGHLACSLGTFWNQPLTYEALGRKPEEGKPDGLILCYPVITSGEFRHPGSIQKLLGEDPDPDTLSLVSLEHQVTGDMPPVFLWTTQTDGTVPVENSLLLAAAIQRAGVSLEFHLYPSGVHGLSLATKETAGNRESLVEPCCQSWISLVQSWIETNYKQSGGQALV